MKVNDKANVTRQQLLDWLADPKDHTLFMQKGTSSAVIVKIPKDSEVEYLFGAGESDGSVVRQEGYLSFCGLFAKGSQSLFVARAPLCTWVEGLTEVERMSRAEIAVHIAQEVNRTVEALLGNDRERLQVPVLSSNRRCQRCCQAVRSEQRHAPPIPIPISDLLLVRGGGSGLCANPHRLCSGQSRAVYTR